MADRAAAAPPDGPEASGRPAPGAEADEGAGAMLLAELLDATRRLTEGAMAQPDYEERLRVLWGRWLDRVRAAGDGEDTET